MYMIQCMIDTYDANYDLSAAMHMYIPLFKLVARSIVLNKQE